jgi:FecR protein
MHKINVSSVVAVVAAACFVLAHSLSAGPLSSAEVTKIINRVSVVDPAKGGHPAAIREVIKNDLGLETGVRSRSELLFQDNTLTRFGAETFFSFKTGTRDLTLEKGSMLLQVPKGLGGAKIHTGAVTAAITGTTIMIEYIPRSYIKVIVLEGSLRLSRNGAFGGSLLLRAGQMVIMKPDAKQIPDPVDINLERIVKTSSLVNFPGEVLPSMGLIQVAIGEQKKQLAEGHLVPTNLVVGPGTNVVIASNGQFTVGSLRANTNSRAVANLSGVTGGLPVSGSITNTGTTPTTVINNVLSTSGSLPAIPDAGILQNQGAIPTVPVPLGGH